MADRAPGWKARKWLLTHEDQSPSNIFLAGHRSRDAEVRELQARVSELEAALDYVQRRCTLYGAADQARAKIDDVLAESQSEVGELVEALRESTRLLRRKTQQSETDFEATAIAHHIALLARYKEGSDG